MRDVPFAAALAARGARVVELVVGSSSLQDIPAELASLTQLTKLSLSGNPITDGWENLPQQLQ